MLGHCVLKFLGLTAPVLFSCLCYQLNKRKGTMEKQKEFSGVIDLLESSVNEDLVNSLSCFIQFGKQRLQYFHKGCIVRPERHGS